jgi:hypothetical protein
MKFLLSFIILNVLLTLSQAWSLPTCPGSPSYEGSTYWDNCVGTYTFSNGDKYEGDWRNDKRHGQGTSTYANGGKYVGEYQDNKKTGIGTFFFSTGDKYIGNFKDDVRYGEGTYIFADGRVWQGQWNNDKWVSGNKFAAGEYNSSSQVSNLSICPDSPSYEGSTYWDNCVGVYNYSNGDKYEGEWREDKRHGQGTYTFSNGDKYVGDFLDGGFHGQGTYTYGKGEWEDDKYIGEYKNDKRNGQGVYMFADGRVWQGQWSNDEWVSGNKFAEGEFDYSSQISSLPTCQGSPSYEGSTYWDNCVGTYTFSSGEIYIGSWKNDKRHGQGTSTYASGDKYIGEYKEDMKHGQGIYTFANGEKYIGEFKNNERHGQGTNTWADGKVWQGEWSNNEWVSGNKYKVGENSLPKQDNNKQNTNPNEIINAASGSGFIVSSSGHIVTNNHVIDGCNDVKVHQKGKIFKATIVDVDYMNDLAIIQADITSSMVFSVSSQDAELLQDIYVAGYPFGATISSSIKVTKGIVSSLSGIGNNYSNMQIDAALQPGNSGGPILDNKGNVVGVAVAKLDLSLMLEEFGAVPEDTNFGIKSSTLITFLRANGIKTSKRSDIDISRTELGQKISDGTLFLSCWMTYAKIEELRTKKVMFENLR